MATTRLLAPSGDPAAAPRELFKGVGHSVLLFCVAGSSRATPARGATTAEVSLARA